MSDATCLTCLYWRKIRDVDHATKRGELWRGPHGECLAIDSEPRARKAWLYVEAGSPDVVGNTLLITQPDFGCMHHSPLDNPSILPEDNRHA